jgi:two-component system NtrC family sensor kinase
MASLLLLAFMVGAVSLVAGGNLLYKAVINEATNRIRFDLSAAHEIYQERIKTVHSLLAIVASEPAFHDAVRFYSIPDLISRLEPIAIYAEMDFAGVVDGKGTIICRTGPEVDPATAREAFNPIIRQVLERKVPLSGTVILDQAFLKSENHELAERARIRLSSNARQEGSDVEEETSGMAIAAAIPVFERGKLIGIVYGGTLLNRNEYYKGRNIGTATIFLNDLRIATNVLTKDGKRQLGTRVSPEVRAQVLDRGKSWVGRAFVVNQWYRTAYEPIEDIFGTRIGMLYVGVLEAKYNDIRNKALFIFAFTTFAGMLAAVFVGYHLANKLIRPVENLIQASQEVSRGNFSPDIGPIAPDEIGHLQTTFQRMLQSLEERDRRSRMESENRLLQSEKQASVGRLAAGVAHEINNPLTGVLTYTYMLLRRKDLTDDIRTDLQTIATSTERVRQIVKGLLDFSRQTALNLEQSDINQVVCAAVSFVENQALLKGISITFKEGDNLPPLTLDRSQIQSVLLNILINALDATETGGDIGVSTGISMSGGTSGQKFVEIRISDTGSGIPADDLDKLFDPFFSTKEVGKGTGLGLSVSLGLVERHGGTIRVKSELGKGSTFYVWIPVLRKDA